jgi:periplasmic divalent cation tolerance protein
VERRLAACVNILPEVRSIYRWGGEPQEDQEALMVIKTTGLAYMEMESWLLEHHPYEVPEVLAIPVKAGSADYLDWVLNEVGAR